MADLEFTRSVPASAQGEGLPKPNHRTVQAQITHFSDIQTAGMQYGDASNWMSAIGSEVAAKASQAIASQIGTELGKNPKGDLGASFTDFDKMMNQSYNTQAQATLGLQAHKLITDTNIELARQPRLTPDLISTAQASIGKGLGEIIKNAPSEIRPHLEYQLGNQAINQSAQLTEKMISQQRQDQKNTIELASATNAENAYSLRMSGDKNSEKAANDLIELTKIINAPLVSSGQITALEAKGRVDTVRKSVKNATVAHDYDQAVKIGKGGEYLKLLQEGKIPGLEKDNPDYASVGNYAMSYVNFRNNLRAEDQNLRLAQLDTAILQDPLKASSQLQELKNILSPLAYEKATLNVLKGVKAYNKQNLENTQAQMAWSNNDSGAFNRQTDSSKDKAFYSNVDKYIKSAAASNNTISQQEGEIAVAASAPGAIPAFIKTLNGLGTSSNPNDLENLGKAISYFRQNKKGANLDGISEKTIAASDLYTSLRRSKIPQEAAEITNNNVYNQSTEDKKHLQEMWTGTINTIKESGKLNYFSKLGGFDKDLISDRLGYVQQAEELFHSNFEYTKGDLEAAKTKTENDLKNTWGETYVNGHKQIAFYPLETAIDLPHDSAGYIQEDIIEFVNVNLQATKKAFEEGSMPYYDEVAPRRTIEGLDDTKHHYNAVRQHFSTEGLLNYENSIIKAETLAGSNMILYRHWKNGVRETFPLIVKADPWLSKTPNPNKPYTGGWDIVLGTKTGYSPLFRKNPMINQDLVYKPDISKIKRKFISDQFKDSGNS